MSEPLENLYFNWLCAKVIRLENPTPTLRYDKLLRILHTTEFVWLLPGDDNRAEDGKELRRNFLYEAEAPDNPEWRALSCSVFEMLVAFSKRAEFSTDVSNRQWFWEFIENLGLLQFNDASNVTPEDVADILYTFVWRQYPPNGWGGLFPLEGPHRDQREVEIWYQFCDYLTDQDRMP